MTITIKNPGYINGDRQQNSNVLANEIVKYLLINCEKDNIDVKTVPELLRSLLVRHYSWFDCDELNKQIEHFELYKKGKSNTPVDLGRYV